MKKPQPRNRKLIKTGLQMRLMAAFGSVVALALFCQFLLLSFFLGRAAAGIEGAGGELAQRIPEVALGVLGLSLLVILPPFLALGTLFTFRVAGPVYRFEQYLKSVASGEQIGPCRIREKDELHSLCDAINLAIEAQRREARGGRDEPSEESAPEQRAA